MNTCTSSALRTGARLVKGSLKRPKPGCRRSYYSYDHQDPPTFTNAETAILSAALSHVPHYGFTQNALAQGARDAGFLDASLNLFPKGAFDLVNYYLVMQRQSLKHRLQLPQQSLSVSAKVRLLALERLRANKAIIHRWQEVYSPTHVLHRCPRVVTLVQNPA